MASIAAIIEKLAHAGLALAIATVLLTTLEIAVGDGPAWSVVIDDAAPLGAETPREVPLAFFLRGPQAL